MFISNTVDDILKNKRGKTEIIVGLDGEWAEPGIVDHPDVRVVYVSESLGQRGMTNALCRLSRAKYVAKSDAHCAFDEGFDVKLMAAMEDDMTIVPTMRNLHAFDWKCMKCGKKTYQGPTPGTTNGISKCDDCGNTDYATFKRKVIWYPKPSPQSKSYCFDPEPHFQYFKDFNKRPEGQGDLTPTMSLQGSFFMLTRNKYWELNICDEQFGSWGSQGIEVAAKTWLTGGKVMCLQTTWYAHMFRTQGGDFSFPYQQSQNKVNEAKAKAKAQFFQGRLENQIHPLSWLVEKFWPVYGWTDADLQKLKETETHGPSKGIIYYTDNQLNLRLAHKVQDQLKSIGLPIVSCSLKPMENMGKNIHLPGERGYESYFKQILTALENSDADIIYFAEHDVLYHPSHFDFIPPREDKFYYNHNWWSVRSDGLAVSWDANRVSQLVGYREHLIKFYRNRINEIERKGFNRSYEPGGRDTKHYEVFRSALPNIDVRHKGTLTGDKWSLDDFKDKSTAQNFESSTVDQIPGWDNLNNLIQ